MQRFSALLALLAFVAIIAGCGGSGATPPSWYGKNLANDSKLIGFGSGKDLESAKANALSDIITQMNVKVDSTFSANTARENSTITHSSSTRVQLDSQKIELNDVKYVKSEFYNSQFYVEAQIAKSDLIIQFQKRFNSTYNALNTTSVSKCESISIKDKVRIENRLDRLKLYAALLQTLGASSKPLNSFENLLNTNSPLPKARLVIEGDNNEYIESDLKKELGHFYSLDNSATQILKAKVSTQDGYITTKHEIIFSIIDCRGNAVFNESVAFVDGENKGAKFASKRTSVQLYKKIQEWIER